MNKAVFLFLLAGWTVGLIIPGADPYLFLTLAVGGGALAAGSGAVCVAALGWCAESIGSGGFGSTIGPLMVVFGILLWIRGQIDWKNSATRAAGFVIAGVIYYVIVSFVTGFNRDMVFLVPLNATLGFVSTFLMERWIGFAMLQRRRKRIAL